MALSGSVLTGMINGKLTARGFVLSGSHSYVGLITDAVGKGVVQAINGSAVVIVPGHAGGTYKVTGLDESLMSSSIRAGMVANKIVLGGEHAFGRLIHESVAEGATAQILATCNVSIPYDGGGTFQIVGASPGGIESAIAGALLKRGVKFGQYGRGDDLAYAIGQSIAEHVNAAAVVSGSFVPGGTFPVL